MLVFENYPGAGTGAGGRAPGGWEIEQVGMEEQFSYPLAGQVFPGEWLGFRLSWDPAVFAAETILEMERRIRAAAKVVLQEEPRTLEAVLRAVGAALPGRGPPLQTRGPGRPRRARSGPGLRG